MKRFTMIVALVLMVAMPTFAERVTSEIAQKVATTFLNNNGAKSAHLTDLSREAGFPNLYIFNAEQGFVVMSADDCVQPILGYSLTGEFVAENMPTNVRGWLQGYNDEIQYAIDSKMSVTAETAQLWKDLAEGNSKAAKATVVVNALVQTTWDQNGFYYYSGGQLLIFELYNNLCPYDNNAGERTVTGCVATAMAQIMKYWNYPAQGIGSHSYTPYTRPDLGVQSANFGETTYEWANMPNQLSQSSTTTQINAIATLMYHCGVSVDMMYDISSNGGSGAYSNDIPYALINYFNYKSTATYLTKSSYTNNNWIALLKSELNAGRPIEYNGSGSGGGHAFVCDGYDNNNNFHFNWGWSGQNDGFFALTSLNPGSGGSGGGSYNFTNDQNAVIGIEPASTIAPPTNLTYTLSGTQNVTLNWVGVSGASSYNVFRNGNLIGNTTSTTYSDTAPYGTTSYYVRSVDSNNQMSLPSNTVTVTIDYPTPVVNDLTGSLSGNNVNLSWTAPEWCYPETPTAILTYGDGNMSNRTSVNYWAHRYLSNDISQYANKTVYKVSFYAYATGSYTCYIYEGANEQVYSGDIIFWPSTLLTSKTIEVTHTGSWIDINLDDLVTINGQDDLWVIMYDPNNGNGNYDAAFSANTGSNNHGGYWGKWNSGDNKGYVLNAERAFLIRTYLTDGTYTYNLYQDGTIIAQNISQTSYDANLNDNAANLLTVKTNYYGGETAASNAIGFAKGTASIVSFEMASNDQMTITENSTLTVSGMLSDANADNLILENGAQLIHNSANVQATVKKNITSYNENPDNGWYLIASPVTESITPSASNGLLANDYDLYKFDQSQELEWRNYKASSFSTIDHKTGYLYANSGNPTLVFTGTLAASAEPTNLTYDTNAEFSGFNLIGNPYPCNAYIDRSFYVLNADTAEFILGSNPIPPCAAILVQAQGSGESVTFSKTASKSEPNISISIAANTRDNAIIDQARVSFNENDQLMKYTLSDQSSKLYIPQNGQDFAVAFVGNQTEMPVNFKATKNGTYTICIEAENLELDYLHLIDNKTGADVDLLATPNYTFEAKTNDYESRFKLVFNEDNGLSAGSEVFAYVNNGEIVITETCPSTFLQIVDMTGRIIVSRDSVHTVSTIGMTPGVYVLRLINNEKVKTQKIVIK